MSEQAVSVREEITEAKITEYLDSMGITNPLLPNEKKLFLNIAREFGLNPFKREIHIVAYGEGKYRKCSIITGYEVYIKRAERTGKLDGWNIKCDGEGKDLKAIVQIHRKDWSHPFIHEVHYRECCQYTKDGNVTTLWAKMPVFMTKKVAIGQAFRLCFSDDLGGMPYEETELPQEETRNVTSTAEYQDVESTQAQQNTSIEPSFFDEKKRIAHAIAQIFNTRSSTNAAYFTEQEIGVERNLLIEAKKNDDLYSQHDRLQKELEKRVAEYAAKDDIPLEEKEAEKELEIW